MHQKPNIPRFKTLFCLTFIFALTASTEAAIDAERNPYALIAQRNVFDLTTPVAVQTIAPTPAQPKASLLGVSTIAGRRQGVFAVTNPSDPVPMPTAPEAWLMSEGQRRGLLEVMRIDVPNRRATVKLDGVISTIALK